MVHIFHSFDEFWTRHLECRSIIIGALDSYVNGSSVILAKRLKSTKHALKIWNNIYFEIL
jgi:hypothetical protein